MRSVFAPTTAKQPEKGLCVIWAATTSLSVVFLIVSEDEKRLRIDGSLNSPV